MKKNIFRMIGDVIEYGADTGPEIALIWGFGLFITSIVLICLVMSVFAFLMYGVYVGFIVSILILCCISCVLLFIGYIGLRKEIPSTEKGEGR